MKRSPTTPILIGYFPKRTFNNRDLLNGLGVEEICSVSGCISGGPGDWINLWRHNELWMYDNPEIGWGVVPDDERDQFRMHAYKVWPGFFDHERLRPVEFPTLRVAPLPASFVRLGFDAVSRSLGNVFECSPLSCNGLASDRKVNRHCLVDTEGEGLELAREFAVSEPEPGPYFLVEVWRQATAWSGKKGECAPLGCAEEPLGRKAQKKPPALNSRWLD